MTRAATAALLFGLTALFACGQRALTIEEYGTQVITLPGGHKIRAEVMTRQEDVMRGMMFRDSLAEDRGMLFVHGEPAYFSYWMYQVKIPLDIIWMDPSRRVVEISANTPPCPSTSARDCPAFGGQQKAQFVLELAGGMAGRYGIQVGSVLQF